MSRMATLVEQLQADALNPHVRVSDLLRKVKLAAAKLKLEKVEDWVEGELNGYKEAVPDYRKVRGAPRIWNPYHGWQPLGGDPDFIERISLCPINQSIAGMESNVFKDGGTLMFEYNPTIVELISKATSFSIPRAGAQIDQSVIVGIIDTVRNLILDWAINLEKAGILGDGLQFNAQELKLAERATMSINIGSIGSFAGNIGTDNVAGNISLQTIDLAKAREFVGEVERHADDLLKAGVDRSDLGKALEAVKLSLENSKAEPTLISIALRDLKRVIGQVSSTVVGAGLLTLLHRLLGTGAA